MKTTLTFVLTCFTLMACGQEFTDQQTFNINMSSLKAYTLINMNGKVSVEGIDGTQATMKVTRKLRSSSSSQLEEAKKTIYFDTLRNDGRMYWFMKHPDYELKIKSDGNAHYRNYNSYGMRDDDKTDYEFTIDFKVPKHLPAKISNHREDLTISNITADLIAHNHHDDLTVNNASGSVDLHTHHGDIEISFAQNPDGNCSYKTHHGDIKVYYKNNLSVDVNLKTRHGAFYTQFDYEVRPMILVSNKENNGTKYKMEGKTAISIGAGGPLHDFETYHGDILLNKQ